MTPTSSLTLLVITLSLAVPALAVDLPDSCGNKEIKFDVRTQKTPPTVGVPSAGKAQLVFLQDENQMVAPFTNATVRFAMDGRWAGATRGRSYFVVSLDPGAHHLCANWQTAIPGFRKNSDAISLNAEAGKTYYFDAAVTVESQQIVTFGFSELNEDQARFRIKSAKLSTFTTR